MSYIYSWQKMSSVCYQIQRPHSYIHTRQDSYIYNLRNIFLSCIIRVGRMRSQTMTNNTMDQETGMGLICMILFISICIILWNEYCDLPSSFVLSNRTGKHGTPSPILVNANTWISYWLYFLRPFKTTEWVKFPLIRRVWVPDSEYFSRYSI